MAKLLWNLTHVTWIATKRLFREGYTYKASALAYTTLLSFVPLISVVVTMVSPFPMVRNWIELTQKFIVTNFIPIPNNLIETYLINFITHATHLSTISFVFLVILSIMLIITIQNAFNDIWRSSENRKEVAYVLLHWLVLILTPFFIGLGIVLSGYLVAFFQLTQVGAKTPYIQIILLPFLSLLFNTLIFSMLYIFAPSFKVKSLDGLIGGFISACLFEIAKKGFGSFVVHFSSYQLIYGALAIIPIFLIWLYLSWLIILFGAILVQAKS